MVARYPLHTLSGILSFSYAGVSPALMGACAKRGISLSFCTPNGNFLARASGEANGNVLLRRAQYRVADDLAQSCQIARTMIFGKLHNARWCVERTRRDHGLRVDSERLSAVSAQLKDLLPQVLIETDLDALHGLEGTGATAYFSVFDQLILKNRRRKIAGTSEAIPLVLNYRFEAPKIPLLDTCLLPYSRNVADSLL